MRVLVLTHSYQGNGAANCLGALLAHWVQRGALVHAQHNGEAAQASAIEQLGAVPIAAAASPQSYDFALINTVVKVERYAQAMQAMPSVLWVHEGRTALANSGMTIGQWMQLLALPKLLVFPHASLPQAVYKSLLLSDAPVAVLPNTLPDSVVHAAANWQQHRAQRLQVLAAGRPFTVVNCGALSPLKRPQDLVLGVNALAQSNVQAHFVGSAQPALLVDDKAFKAEVLNAASAPQAKGARFTFHGELPHGAVHQFWPHADAYVSCSQDESQGMAALEAACHGVVPVLTNLPCYQGTWQHGRNALLYPVGDSKALAAALQSLLQNPQLRSALGENARKTALGFTGDRFFRSFDAALAKYGITKP